MKHKNFHLSLKMFSFVFVVVLSKVHVSFLSIDFLACIFSSS